MAYKIIVKPAAKTEILKIKRWYEDQKAGLGIEFINELRVYIHAIKKNHSIFQVKYQILYAIVLKRFPYLAYYSVENNTIFIHAVIASKQDQESILSKQK